MPPQSSVAIHLEPAEWVLIELLLDYRASLPYDSAQDLQIRFVGKHVRYKLLGQTWNEIEVSINTCPLQFRSELKALYFRGQEKYTTRAESLGAIPNIGIIKYPIKLMIPPYRVVYQVTIFGLDICFTDSRAAGWFNPIIFSPETGRVVTDAVTDAFNRDATIDSLAYNVVTQEIEDSTGYGLHDLKNGIIRTPIHEGIVLKKDPFCFFRLIREACTTGYRISHDMVVLMKNTSVLRCITKGKALHKFSIDNLRAEIMEIINGADPGRGLSLIHMSLLYPVIFVYPRVTPRLWQIHSPRLGYQFGRWKSNSSLVYSTVDCLLADPIHRKSNMGKHLLWIDTENLWLLAVFSHFGQLRTNIGTAKRDEGIVETIANEARAFHPETAISDLLRDCLKNMNDIHSYVEEPDFSSLKRSDIGLALRYWGITWRFQVLYAMLADIAHIAFDRESLTDVLLRYDRFLGYIFDNKLEYALFLDPILTRQDIEDMFDLRKRSCLNALVYEAVVSWQLDNPRGSRQEVIEWVSHMILTRTGPRSNGANRDRTGDLLIN
ncbi:CCA tRNA nucleotidyltransferase, mitochondrial [Microsporum audouinii]